MFLKQCKNRIKNIKKCDPCIFFVIAIVQKLHSELWPILLKNFIILDIK